ncbi:sulfite exporter TauE/SafE family protein [Roseibium sp. MMSF_3544]|uniref:sulfite exporter TauE/SafE family protein n=1 Tax=unclassified Roseibium TaxID=2629323 RepID=UPI00273EBCAB|nr:sulfite exporter TauE/SafE family protein [Roseibium sp. MMSF_3544]
MTNPEILLLVFVGLIGGVWNAIAGGATLFTFPALMFAGLPPVVANATNFLGLLPSNAAALAAYGEELRRAGPQLITLSFVSGAGAAAGSMLLLISDPGTFVVLVPFLLAIATLLFAFGEQMRKAFVRWAGPSQTSFAVYGVLFCVSVYGGYFGAGLGIILLAIAQVIGHTDFHAANSMKNLLATNFTIISIVIFGVGGLIDWPAALVMMIGSTLGGYFGGRWAKRVNQKVLRILVIGFGTLLSAVYFWRTFAVDSV